MAKGVKTGGRQKGTPNKITKLREEILAAEGETPLEVMLRVMRTATDVQTELEAAKAAAPYCHPKLAITTLKGDPDEPLHHKHEVDVTAEALAALEAAFGEVKSTAD